MTRFLILKVQLDGTLAHLSIAWLNPCCQHSCLSRVLNKHGIPPCYEQATWTDGCDQEMQLDLQFLIFHSPSPRSMTIKSFDLQAVNIVRPQPSTKSELTAPAYAMTSDRKPPLGAPLCQSSRPMLCSSPHADNP